MKAFFAIIFILIIGLFLVSGCASNSIEPQQAGSEQIPSPPALPQETETSAQETQQQAGSEQIPSPPALPEE